MKKAAIRLFKRLPLRSIQSTMMIAFAFLILFTVIIMGIVAYRLNFEAVEKNAEEYIDQLIDQVGNNIDSYITNMNSISEMALYNYDINQFLTDEYETTAVTMARKERISAFFYSILRNRKDISSIMLFGYNGRNVIENKRGLTALNPSVNLLEQPWYKSAVEAGGNSAVSSSHVQNMLEDDRYRWVVSLSRELIKPMGDKKMGVLLVDMNYSIINDMCSKIELGKRGYIFILDSKGNIVYHPQQQLIYSNIKHELIDEVLSSKTGSFITSGTGEKRLYVIKESQSAQWKIVGVAYLNELVRNRTTMQRSYVLWGSFCFAIAILLSITLSLRISRPVKRLESSMRLVEQGNFDIQAQVESANEIGELSRAFNIMTQKIKELMSQIVLEQEQKRRSELKALQAQINPHFLYNTLDSIIWMAESKKNEEVVKMASALSKLFRLSISKGEEFITLRSEIEYIRSYLTIQQMRYRDKLNFSIAVDAEILVYKIPKITMQPLVENAIYHGIKNRPDSGTVLVTGHREGGDIVLSVIDDGIGMTHEKATYILEHGSDTPLGSSGGVGVKNVNERLKLYFGDKYGLTFTENPEGGTVAVVRIPIID